MVKNIKKLLGKVKNKIINNLKIDVWRRRIMSSYEYKVWCDQQILCSQVNIKYHHDSESSKRRSSTVFFMSDDEWVSGGLCDKLRGVISLYTLCERMDIPFKIYWISPFVLTDYLLPNMYDWEPDYEITRDHKSKAIQVMSYYGYSNEEEKKYQEDSLLKYLNKYLRKNEIHVYTNAHFGNSNFNRVFSLLFKPSLRIQSKLNEYLPSQRYISMSFRFLQLLGDFKDRSGGETLPDDEKQMYIEDGLKLIERMYSQDNGYKILVASDSHTFVKKACKLEYVFSIPGQPKHSDLPADNYDKEFLDFFAISRAERVFLCKKGKMYTSGFPYYASLAGGKPFEILEY